MWRTSPLPLKQLYCCLLLVVLAGGGQTQAPSTRVSAGSSDFRYQISRFTDRPTEGLFSTYVPFAYIAPTSDMMRKFNYVVVDRVCCGCVNFRGGECGLLGRMRQRYLSHVCICRGGEGIGRLCASLILGARGARLRRCGASLDTHILVVYTSSGGHLHYVPS